MTVTEHAPPAVPDELVGRDRILRIAAELFLRKGYAETSLRTIADAAGMRPASIYHHFDGKDALLTEILEIGMAAVTDAFVAIEDEGRSLPPRDRLRRHAAAHLDALFAHQAFTAAHVTVFPFAPEAVRAVSVPDRDRYEARWSAMLAEIAPGLDDEAIRLVRLSLFGAMNSSVQWFDPAGGSPDELATAIVHTLWNGLAHEGAANA